jgi:L-ascorbate metabolism protein UlaG (beta-lactamase superfamily)
MSTYEAAHATRLLDIRHVVPIHYGTFPFLPGTAEEFQQHVSEIAPGVTVHVMKPGDELGKQLALWGRLNLRTLPSTRC